MFRRAVSGLAVEIAEAYAQFIWPQLVADAALLAGCVANGRDSRCAGSRRDESPPVGFWLLFGIAPAVALCTWAVGIKHLLALPGMLLGVKIAAAALLGAGALALGG